MQEVAIEKNQFTPQILTIDIHTSPLCAKSDLCFASVNGMVFTKS